MGSGVAVPGSAEGRATEEEVWMDSSEAATVLCVRRAETGWELACARSLPWEVVRRRVGSCGLWFACRKALRRFVKRRGVAGAVAAIVGEGFLYGCCCLAATVHTGVFNWGFSSRFLDAEPDVD